MEEGKGKVGEQKGLKGLLGVNMGRENSGSVGSKPSVSKIGNVGSGGSTRSEEFFYEKEREDKWEDEGKAVKGELKGEKT